MLAMPFCYKECGIILGSILLFFCTWLTLASCKMLMKAGLTSRKRSYGFLAYYTHGVPGKVAVEIGMIGLQIGTLVAQVVVVGDLGPAIISKYTGIQNSSHLRTGLIIVLCIGVGLPLGLLRNLKTVSKASSLCICFYAVFVCYMIFLSLPNLLSTKWYNRVVFWKTDGLFKCLPIFSFAFGCQTQLFLLYDSMDDPTLKSINYIVSSAVNTCSGAYLLVGFFGYVTFCDSDITGDIINDVPSSFTTDLLKLGFVISIAITFPLIIFPCRSCLYTLLFPQRPKVSEDMEERPVLPEIHFKVLTVLIVLSAVVTGIFVPNVEFVLALNGATVGSLICYIFPAMFFLKVLVGSSEGKSVAQFVFICGFTMLLLCTYTTLNAQNKGHIDIKPIKPPEILKPVSTIPVVKKDDIVRKLDGNLPVKDQVIGKESRVEPPNPKPPIENKSASDKIDDKQKLILLDKDKKNEENNKVGQIDEKKEGKDLKAEDKKKDEGLDKQNEILQEMKKQQEEQQRLIDEQKKILAELKEHQNVKHHKKLNKQEQVVQQQPGAGRQSVQVQMPEKLENNGQAPQVMPADNKVLENVPVIADNQMKVPENIPVIQKKVEPPIIENNILNVNKRNVQEIHLNLSQPVNDGKGKVDNDIDNLLKSKDKQIKANPIDVNDEMKRKLLSSDTLQNNLGNTVIKSR